MRVPSARRFTDVYLDPGGNLFVANARSESVLSAFAFRACAGQADALHELLNNPDAARHVARSIGAQRNLLLRQGDQFFRVFEFTDDANPISIAELAERDPDVKEFLSRIGRLTEPSYDPDNPATLVAFMQDAAVDLVLDVRT